MGEKRYAAADLEDLLNPKRLRADGTIGEIRIPQQYVGWMKGTKGGQIKAIEERSGATVSIDQQTKDLGYSLAVIHGTPQAVLDASTIIEAELARVMERDGFTSETALTGGLPLNVGDSMAEVHIPQKYVGWLKGSGGSQIKEMETRSGATVRIDQTTRELGYSIAHITGNAEGVLKCKALVEAEIHRVQERDRMLTEHESLPAALQPREHNEVQIPQAYVGWVKGAGGSQIRDIEQRTGAHITIDQSTQTLGYSRAVIYGTDEAIREAKRILLAEIERCQVKDGGNSGGGQSLAAGGGGAGPGGLGALTSALSGGGGGRGGGGLDPLASVIALIAGIAGAAGGQRGQDIQTVIQALLPTILGASGGGGNNHRSSSHSAAPAPRHHHAPLHTVASEYDHVRIPNDCVGWLKGKQGAMIREIENRSGAQVDIDQSEKETGWSVVRIRGMLDQQRTAQGLIIGEVMKVCDNPMGASMDCSHLGMKDELRVDVQYVGWVKGPKGKVVQDIQVRSGTRIDVDQIHGDNMATVKIYGTYDGVKTARSLLANELRKVNPDLAQEISGDAYGYEPAAADVGVARTPFPSSYASGSSIPLDPVASTGGPYEMVRIPNTCVGWLKGRQGAMIREIETRSGVQVDIDQSTADQGYALAFIRGAGASQRLGHGLVVAEVLKVADNSHELDSVKDLGMKEELRLEVQYVGWVKGPKGKVVQDIQLRSGTRVDVDQSNRESGYAVVKIYGTHEGVTEAKRLIAAELGKISPEVANSIDGSMSYMSAAPAPSAAPVFGQGSSGDSQNLSSAFSNLAQVGQLFQQQQPQQQQQPPPLQHYQTATLPPPQQLPQQHPVALPLPASPAEPPSAAAALQLIAQLLQQQQAQGR